MIARTALVILTLSLTGCAFIQEATTRRPAEASAVAVHPCSGLEAQAYYQCMSYQEQVRANRINNFNQIYGASQQGQYPVRRVQQTNCHTDNYGNTSCQSY